MLGYNFLILNSTNKEKTSTYNACGWFIIYFNLKK